MSNINITIRVDKDKIEKLKDIARKLSVKEKKNISYNDLITQCVYEKYFNNENS